MKVLGVYFSGTGNTAFVMNKIGENLIKEGHNFSVVSIENDILNIERKVVESDLLIFGFPVYGSMAPLIMRNFIKNNSALFSGKKACVIATQYLFSGDGGAYFARMLRKKGVKVLDIEHFNMPNNISDMKLFSIKTSAENKMKIENTLNKIASYAKRISLAKYKLRGDNFVSWCMGFFSQRFLFQFGEQILKKNIKIDSKICNLCGVCVKICPMSNLQMGEKTIIHNNNCTACYRCINSCPNKALSLFSKDKPKIQYKGIHYIN